MEGDLYTAEEAAEEVGVTESAIRIWVHRGYLVPAGKRGKRNLFRIEDVFECEKNRSRKHRHAT